MPPKQKRTPIKRFLRFISWSFLGLLLMVFTVFACDFWVKQGAKSELHTKVSEVPKHDVALVLGTVARLSNGYRNLFFEYRMNAAAELYKNGKVKHFILSGDNHSKGYDEPSDMKAALMKRGVPARAITLDYAGFRTLDSIVRAKEIFGQDKLTIVSQPFHNERALFIARAKGIEAHAFNAKSVSRRYGFKIYVREYFARVKAVLDVYVLGTKPKFLGKKEPISV